MEFLLGTIFPYTACSIFVFGTILRIVGWLKTPVPFHLTLFPAPESTLGRIAVVASDFLCCSSLFREDKALWLRVWLFHLSLALIVTGHVVGIFYLRDQFTLVGFGSASSQFLSKLLGGTSGVVMLLALGALIIGRIVNPVVRKLSAPEDFFTLLLLISIAVSGLLMYLPVFHVDLPAIRAYLVGLLYLQPTPLPHSPLFVIHFLLVNLLLLYFPFSRLLHSTGYFVNRAMLTEAPPVYPTPAGNTPRTRFAKAKAKTDLPVSRKETGDREVRQP
ncbi:MAG: respiratory nitrate reductase subunit gamma [Geobacteraceae bacterium]